MPNGVLYPYFNPYSKIQYQIVDLYLLKSDKTFHSYTSFHYEGESRGQKSQITNTIFFHNNHVIGVGVNQRTTGGKAIFSTWLVT